MNIDQRTAPAADAVSGRPPGRVPFNAFGVAFGLAGLAGTWTAAEAALGAPRAVAEALWVLAAVVWAVTLVRYALRLRSVRDIADDLRHPVLGPFAALVPTVGSLVAAHLTRSAPTAGRVAVDVFAVVALVLLAWFVADLLTRPRDLAALHGGYLLPTVAASLIAAQSFAVTGQQEAAMAAFGVGILFWLLVGAVLLARFAAGPPIPPALLPTLAIFSAPPAVAGNAWWAMAGTGTPAVHDVLLGALVALIVPQLFLARRYLRLPFGLGFWALTFTTAASATYALRLVTRTAGTSETVVGWLLVAAATLLIGAIAVRSLVFLRRG